MGCSAGGLRIHVDTGNSHHVPLVAPPQNDFHYCKNSLILLGQIFKKSFSNPIQLVNSETNVNI